MITEEEDNDKIGNRYQKLIQYTVLTRIIENLLTLNDMINNVMAKFADVRKGLYDTHYEISGKQPTQQTEESPRQAISLIDLDEDTNINSASAAAASNNALNELSDIFGSTGISSAPVQQPDIFTFTTNQQPDIFATTTAPAAPRTKQPDIFDLLGGGIPTTTTSSTSSPVIASPLLSNTSMPSHRTPSPQLEVTDAIKKGTLDFLLTNNILNYYLVSCFGKKEWITY
jgi:type II secretory pathway pseudopilin PulG